MRKKLVVCTLSLVLCMSSKSTYATNTQTAEDLFKLYSNKAEVDYDGLKQEYINSKKEYESLNKTVKELEAYNKMYDTAEAYMNEKKKELSNKVDGIMKENISIAKSIENNLTGDFRSLVERDAQYKTNLALVDKLLEERNKYSMSERKEIDFGKLDKLKGEMSKLKKKYDKAMSEKSLGTVYKLKYPLGKPTQVTSKFGDRVDPMTNKSIRFHAGIDLKAGMNTEVLSIFNGTVAGTGYGPLGGYFVRIDHDNGIVSYYCHLSSINCIVGQKVKQYDVIALSGNSGSRTTEPHLHFGLYINGIAVDPGVLFGGKNTKNVQ